MAALFTSLKVWTPNSHFSLVHHHHKLNMDLKLQSLCGLHVHCRTHWLRPRTPPPSIWAHIRGRYWSAKIDDISLCDPLTITEYTVQRARLSFQSSRIGPPTPTPAREWWSSPLWVQGGDTLGGGGTQFRRRYYIYYNPPTHKIL